MNTRTILLYRTALVGLSLLLLLPAVACGGTTPPGPDTVGGSIEGATYTLLHWEDGLRVMFWYAGARAAGTSGGGSTGDPTHRQQGYAQLSGGREVTWELEAQDGQRATLRLEGETFELQEDALFLVQRAGDEVQVQRIQRDLSGVTPTVESVKAFARSDADVQAFIEEANAN